MGSLDAGGDDVLDLLVIGGGVMGLFTAYHASRRSARVAVIERGRIGDPTTASFGQTRTYRKDYLDARYARLALEAMGLWAEFEADTGTEVLVRCGCMNIAKTSVTPDLAATYAQLSFQTLSRLGLPPETLDGDEIRRRFPYLRADLAHLDPDAGVVNLPRVTAALTGALEAGGAEIRQGVEVTGVENEGGRIRVRTTAGEMVTRALVITAGHGTNDVLAQLPGCTLRIPITKDRPSDAKYFVPPAALREQFTADAMPVIAYLDTGIYLHPIVPGLVEAVKIGYYNPPDMPRGETGIDSIASFVTQCLPGLRDATVRDVVEFDQCDYDLVDDDEFVLGPVPGFDHVFVGVGWRGTGYKFSPWVGRVLFELALREGTVYDISRFDPARFEATRFKATRFEATRAGGT
jgi:glycine/D-amino acid oxidase-like deaminating enzyme